MNKNYDPLFQPFKFKSGVELRNRLIMAPMTTFSADDNDYVSDEELAYYRSRSNEIGMIVTACAYVSNLEKDFMDKWRLTMMKQLKG